ncbi:aryl-sulfate sulfotransferase N-terminal domain-containing protein [uncultured Eudoraea sp.]|uniref:aryl-sulfate sulfotransferase N-terminal domain-containing protein n=1 Tax=uncultured Eudoraea sp. TaxID=1035614 RepID=UPI003457DF98
MIKSTLNPHIISPLTASLKIEAEKPCYLIVIVLVKKAVEQPFNNNATNLEISVLGLYPYT